MFNYDGKGDLLTETWKDIKGWEGQYKVSNVGKVQSLKKSGRLRKPSLTDDGYLVLDLYGKNKREKVLVHRLVATAFLSGGKDLTGLEVNHIDGNKLNNSVENLEWVSPSQNCQHAWNTGLQKKKYGKDHFLSTNGIRRSCKEFDKNNQRTNSTPRSGWSPWLQ